MDEEPLLPTFHRPLSAAGRRRLSSTPPSPTLFSLPESQEVTLPLPTSPRPPSLKHLLIFGSPDDPAPPLSPAGVGTPADDLQWQLFRAKSNLHRSKTAPAMATINDLDHSEHDHDQPPSPVSPSIVRQAFLLLLLYLSLGVVIYYLNRHQFAAAETHPVVDALYFCIVTMCTIGYGDITPSSPATKIFSILFVLVGFGFIDILLSGVVSYVLDLQEKLLLTAVKGSDDGAAAGGGGGHSYLVDVKKGRMRIRMKVALALGVVVVCVGAGTAAMHFVEHLGWLDSFYLSVMSVTTVGYGDRAFNSMPGRLFASIWLLVSTLAVARAFLYLAEARIDKRHRQMAKWVLGKELTVSDLLAADIDNNGFVRLECLAAHLLVLEFLITGLLFLDCGSCLWILYRMVNV